VTFSIRPSHLAPLATPGVISVGGPPTRPRSRLGSLGGVGSWGGGGGGGGGGAGGEVQGPDEAEPAASDVAQPKPPRRSANLNFHPISTELLKNVLYSNYFHAARTTTSYSRTLSFPRAHPRTAAPTPTFLRDPFSNPRTPPPHPHPQTVEPNSCEWGNGSG
jgi:hypothetical protein